MMNRISERVNIAACLGFALLILLPIGKAEGASENASKLLDLARKKFGTLTEAEEKLFQAVVNGETADCSDRLEKNNDPNMAKDWDQNTRVIRAKCIVWLCTDPEASVMVTHKGIFVKGARIDEQVNLAYARVSFPLDFEKSAFPGGINLRYAEIRDLFLGGTHTGPTYGSGLRVKGYVFLRNGFKAKGEVNLVGATIGGNLECDGSQFINKGADALKADGANIEGDVFLRNGFKAEGEVRLVGATISGNLECDGSQFINKGAKAINADGVNIEGYVFLRNGFKAEGEVRLVGATIGGSLGCEKGGFINPTGYALLADNSNIKGGVYLRNGFKAEGEVRLAGATIDTLFTWTDVNSPEKATLDLRSATVGTLWDDQESWPDEGKLFLHGLVYNEIYDRAPRGAESRIDWLRRQYDNKAEEEKKQFRPQPYEQLAEVLRKSGQDDDAKKILIAKNKDRARLTKLTWSKKYWYRVLGPMIGYGYRPLNALWGVGAFVVLGWILFGIGYWLGLITPQSESAYVQRDTKIVIPGDDKRNLSDVYPRFNFWVYSIDVFVPLVDLHQASYWLPNANLKRELPISESFKLHISGRVLRCYFWLHITMGWFLTTLLALGLTGLIRT